MMYSNTTPQPTRRGIALMLVMIAVLVTGTMAVAYFGSRDNSVAISANVEASSRARANAESGIDLAIAILETNADWRTQHTDGVILDSFAFGGGELTLTVIDVETDLPPTESTNKVDITIMSSIDGISQTTQATATIFPDDEEFDVDYSEYAIFAQSQITVQDGASIDHWNASPLASQQNQLRIGTLATSPMSVRLNTWSHLPNTIELHTRSHASSMLSSSLSRAHELPSSMPFPNPPTPPIENELFKLNSTNRNKPEPHKNNQSWANMFAGGLGSRFSRNDKNIDVQSGSYEIDDLFINRNKHITIHGDVTLTISNTLTLKSTSILLADNATLTVHVGGHVQITSSYIGNLEQSTNAWIDPNKIQLYGQAHSNWDINGNSTIKGEIYAPMSRVELSGRSTLCGRIAANEVTLRGASRLLYDSSLDHGGFADSSSSLYDDGGELLSEVKQLTRLDPVLIDALYEAIFETASNTFLSFQDWWDEPTKRPHEVIYSLVVYGVDARRWESFGRHARQNRSVNFASVIAK
jgi:hypothetical protein